MNSVQSAYTTGIAIGALIGLLLGGLIGAAVAANWGRIVAWVASRRLAEVDPLEEAWSKPLPKPRDVVVASAHVSKADRQEAATARQVHIAKSPEAKKYATPPAGQESRVTIGSRRQIRAAGLPLLAEDQPTQIIRTDDWKTAELNLSVAQWTQEQLDPSVIP